MKYFYSQASKNNFIIQIYFKANKIRTLPQPSGFKDVSI